MSLLQEASQNIQRQRKEAEEGELSTETQAERSLQQETDNICRQLRSESERLLNQYGTRIPIFGRNSLSGKAFAALGPTLILPFTLQNKVTSRVFARKELKTELNDDEEPVEIIIDSSNADPQKSHHIRICIEGIPEYLTLYKNGQGRISHVNVYGNTSEHATLHRVIQYKEILNKVKDRRGRPLSLPNLIKLQP